MPFVNPEDIAQGKLRCLFYGPTGVGKTHLCATALNVPELCPILFVDTDGGLPTIRDIAMRHKDKIKILRLEDALDDRRLQAAIFTNPGDRFKTVILDSLNEYYAFQMDMHLEAEGRAGQAPYRQDYGTLYSSMMGFIRDVKNKSKVHFIATASESYLEDGMTGALHISPGFVGKLSEQIPNLFHIVGYLTVEIVATQSGQLSSAEWTLQLLPYGKVKAKARLSREEVLASIKDPTMHKIFQLVQEGVASESKTEAVEKPKTTAKSKGDNK